MCRRFVTDFYFKCVPSLLKNVCFFSLLLFCLFNQIFWKPGSEKFRVKVLGSPHCSNLSIVTFEKVNVGWERNVQFTKQYSKTNSIGLKIELPQSFSMWMLIISCPSAFTESKLLISFAMSSTVKKKRLKDAQRLSVKFVW